MALIAPALHALAYDDLMGEIFGEMGGQLSPEESAEFMQFLEAEGGFPMEEFAPAEKKEEKKKPEDEEKAPVDRKTLFLTPPLEGITKDTTEEEKKKAKVIITGRLKDAFDYYVDTFLQELQSVVLKVQSYKIGIDIKSLAAHQPAIDTIEPSLKQIQGLELTDKDALKKHPYLQEFFKLDQKATRESIVNLVDTLKDINKQIDELKDGEEIFRVYDPKLKRFIGTKDPRREKLKTQLIDLYEKQLSAMAQNLETVLASKGVKKGIKKLKKKIKEQERNAARRQKSYKGSYSDSHSGSSFGSWSGWDDSSDYSSPSGYDSGGYGSYGGYSGYDDYGYGGGGYDGGWSSGGYSSPWGGSTSASPSYRSSTGQKASTIEPKDKKKPSVTYRKKKKPDQTLIKLQDEVIGHIKDAQEALALEEPIKIVSRKEKTSEEEETAKIKEKDKKITALLSQKTISWLKESLRILVRKIKSDQETKTPPRRLRARTRKRVTLVKKKLTMPRFKPEFTKTLEEFIPIALELAKYESNEPLPLEMIEEIMPTIRREQAAAVQIIDITQKNQIIKTIDSLLIKEFIKTEEAPLEQMQTIVQRLTKKVTLADLQNFEKYSYFFLKPPHSLAYKPLHSLMYKELAKTGETNFKKHIEKLEGVQNRIVGIMKKELKEKKQFLILLTPALQILTKKEQAQLTEDEQKQLHELMQEIMKKQPELKANLTTLTKSTQRTDWSKALQNVAASTSHHLQAIKKLAISWMPSLIDEFIKEEQQITHKKIVSDKNAKPVSTENSLPLPKVFTLLNYQPSLSAMADRPEIITLL